MKNPRVPAPVVLFVIAMMSAVLLNGCGSANKEAPASALAGVAAIGFTQCYNCHADAKNPASFPAIFGDSAAGASTPLVTGVAGTVQTSGPDFRTAMRGWVNGPHGNYESGTPDAKTDNAPANTGVPAYADFTDNTCQSCHDPLGDGKTIADFAFSTGVFLIGLENRPVIGCESCHGGGANHWGLGPLPFASPDAGRCGQCHTERFPTDGNHIAAHPEGSGIFEAYGASKHARSVNSSVREVSGSTTDVVAPCARCHTDEGARRYLLISAGTMTYGELVAALDGKPTIRNASAVQCRTCHDGHNQLIILGQKVLDAGILPPVWSDEFATCTSCHQLLTVTPDGTYPSVYTLQDKAYHNPYDMTQTTVNPFSGWDGAIVDTHYDDPSTGNIEGYIVDFTSSHDPTPGNANSGTCRDCHNTHNADTTINKQWARSAHGGEILDIKEQASNVYTAAVTTVEGIAWVVNDFKSTASNRQPCHRCHTSTGFRNFANSPTTYNAANDSYVATGNQKEMLYCWGCHTDTVGDLRSPGGFFPPAYVGGTVDVTSGSATVTGTGTNWNTDNTPVGSLFQVAGDTATYIVQAVNLVTSITITPAYGGTSLSGANYRVTPYIVPTGRAIAGGLAGSFVCVSCHPGRETGEFIKSYPVAINGKNFGTFNSHYLAAGGILYRTIGYEYAGPTYSNPLNFTHDTIGVSVAGTGTNGPCVGCHMQNTQSHLFLPTQRDPNTNLITSIPSGAVCAVCHGTSMTAARLNMLETQYDAALAALQGSLNVKGTCWTSGYPYFKIYDTINNICTATNFTAWPDNGTLGAAFNMNMLERMPMAFVHNSTYTRRLIFDSIDFLDDGLQNGSVAATINGLAPVYITSQEAADALTFLNNGVRP